MEIEAEQTLVEALQAGDTAALEALMERYTDRVYRVAYGITRNAEDAEEVVQDVFLTVFRKINAFERRATLGTWMYRIATNAALNQRRGKRLDLEMSLEDCLPMFLPDGHRQGDRALLQADWSQTPEQELLSRETRGLLDRAIDELPEQYRAVLVLRDIEGLSNEGVADVVGESVACVKSRIHRARMALRERLTRSLAPRHKGLNEGGGHRREATKTL
jgi:RNA polymerase sigma-70 factor (ECF subfamily)